MKNLTHKINILIVVLILAIGNLKAQLPLVFGDGVITHSPTKHPALGQCTTPGIVVRTVKTNNTTTAPFGTTNWNIPASGGTKPPNWYAPNWTEQELGSVFGVTLDQNTNPNIYVSSTQIYNGSASYKRIVWKLDAISGANTLVYDFGNAPKSLGNLKYYKIGTTDNIYVSDWETGKIQRLTTPGVPWLLASNYTPTFPGASSTPNGDKNMVYGLAVRKIGTTYRLYFSRISTYTNASTGSYGNNEIYSIGLNSTDGNFTGTETKETIPVISWGSTSWGGYPNLSAPCSNSIYVPHVLPVISDIAFTNDGKKMLIGQQSWGETFGYLAPHNSGVYEFSESIPWSTSWGNSGNLFGSGSCGSLKNCAGGVSYSNNILLRDNNSFACDTTVFFSADCIKFSSGNFVYGLQGMRSSGGSLTSSIWIDEDDDLDYYDKNDLGDVEIYKKPLECEPCNCGQWLTAPLLNGTLISPVSSLTKPPTITYPIQFVQGNVSGLINASFQCIGSCGATYSWAITNNVTAAIVASGTALPVELASYNSSFKCGKYTLVIKPKCGTNDCASLIIPITIICEPPSCCQAVIDISLESNSISTAINIPNPNVYSVGTFNFLMNFSLPMSEVRVSVEEFKLVANSPNCLNCNNRPVTWGNILTASLNGSPMVLSGNLGVPTGTLSTDYREAVYNTGLPLLPSSAGLAIQLSLPAVTDVTCCEVSAYVCLKFTFKDTQCRECVQMVCGNIKLNPPKNPKGGSLPNKTELKKYKIEH